MDALDPRHGTRAGYCAHINAGTTTCPPCRRAEMIYRKQALLDQMAGRARILPAVGTRRRLRALIALGHTCTDLGRHLGISTQAVHNMATREAPTVRATTAHRIARLYDALHMTRPDESPSARYARTVARKRGWAPPLAWDDIDDPDEQPTGWQRTTEAA